MTWIGMQIVLLAMLALAPGKRSSTSAAQFVVVAPGAALIIWSARRLGRSLTPFPEPIEDGRLTSAGPYRYIRHPMYVGVVLAAAGFSALTRSPARVAVTLALAVFFDAKARYEEAALMRAYPGYRQYVASTRRFVPLIY